MRPQNASGVGEQAVLALRGQMLDRRRRHEHVHGFVRQPGQALFEIGRHFFDVSPTPRLTRLIDDEHATGVRRKAPAQLRVQTASSKIGQDVNTRKMSDVFFDPAIGPMARAGSADTKALRFFVRRPTERSNDWQDRRHASSAP